MPKKRVLAIPDLHLPGMLPNYPDFLRQTYKDYKCDTVIFLGDVFNFGALSFHMKMAGDANIEDEVNACHAPIKRLARMFPRASLLEGNHDANPGRQCDAVGIPRTMMRTFNDFWDMPKTWKWYPRYHKHIIDGVIYQHGDQGKGGAHPALANAKAEFRSVVQGHYHTACGVWFHANTKDLVFGMQAGTGCDHNHPMFDYSRAFTQKPVVACGVIIDGLYPYIERMVL